MAGLGPSDQKDPQASIHQSRIKYTKPDCRTVYEVFDFKLMEYELQTFYGIWMCRHVAYLTHFALTNICIQVESQSLTIIYDLRTLFSGM